MNIRYIYIYIHSTYQYQAAKNELLIELSGATWSYHLSAECGFGIFKDQLETLEMDSSTGATLLRAGARRPSEARLSRLATL